MTSEPMPMPGWCYGNRLAAIYHLFDWLVTGQVVPVKRAASVRRPPTS
jgi:hypothetical protein